MEDFIIKFTKEELNNHKDNVKNYEILELFIGNLIDMSAYRSGRNKSLKYDIQILDRRIDYFIKQGIPINQIVNLLTKIK